MNVRPSRRHAFSALLTGSAVLAVETGVGRSFQYGTINGLNTFVVKAVDRSGNTSAASNTVTTQLWTC